ncbi:hypothetical protein [Pseudoxanthomonas mexicana]
MNMIEVCEMAFEADIAGATEEARVSAKVVTSAIQAVAKVITELL